MRPTIRSGRGCTAEKADLIASGVGEAEATKRAGFRIFGSKPGAYGAGLQALIDEKGWTIAAIWRKPI